MEKLLSLLRLGKKHKTTKPHAAGLIVPCRERAPSRSFLLWVLGTTAASRICHLRCRYRDSMLCNILEILRYRNPDVKTFKCKCGVPLHARCFDRRPALYISLKQLTSSVLCQPPPNTAPPTQKKKKSWIALAYITQLCAHQSVRAVFMFAPRCFSWRSCSKGGSGNGKGEVLVSKHAQAPAYLRCLAGIIVTAHFKHSHTHTDADLPAHAQQKQRNSSLIVKQNAAAREHYTWTDWQGGLG